MADFHEKQGVNDERVFQLVHTAAYGQQVLDVEEHC